MASEAAAPVAAATEAYERWLGKRLDIVEADLKLKHKLMQGSVFVFLRGHLLSLGGAVAGGCA